MAPPVQQVTTPVRWADSLALRRYLDRHIEPGLPRAPAGCRWRHVVVVPAYDEPPASLENYRRLPTVESSSLVILVMNRPEGTAGPDCNRPLRQAISALPRAPGVGDLPLFRLRPGIDLFLYDVDRVDGPIPRARGVGLARKLGCDIALLWMSSGHIVSDWICSSDADALLPADYFARLAGAGPAAVAATYPFLHTPGNRSSIDRATRCYELRLHYYVLGLDYAGSPYARHTLGSALAVRALPYTQVRGVPRRAGGEDFYLLNKLAKLGPVPDLAGEVISLQSRESHRVPFGTGPAVAGIAAQSQLDALPLFYHPRAFLALRAALDAAGVQQREPALALDAALATAGLEGRLREDTARALLALGWSDGLAHCHRQGGDRQGFMRHFHQWFDGFRTLKFIHALRRAGWADRSLRQLPAEPPWLWPCARHTPPEPELLLQAALDHRHWQVPPP